MNRRIIVIDDDTEVLQDFQRTLAGEGASPAVRLAEAEREIFGRGETACDLSDIESYHITVCPQGQEGLALVEKAVAENRPYAVAFVDMRMPPGWDGLETSRRIRAADPNIEIVIVTAFADYSRVELIREIGAPAKLLYIKKPFDADEIRQLALSLTLKWNLEHAQKTHREDMATLIEAISDISDIGFEDFAGLLTRILRWVVKLMRLEDGIIFYVSDNLIEFSEHVGTMDHAAIVPTLKRYLERVQSADSESDESSDRVNIISAEGLCIVRFFQEDSRAVLLVLKDVVTERANQDLLRIFIDNALAEIEKTFLLENLKQSNEELQQLNRRLKEYSAMIALKMSEQSEVASESELVSKVIAGLPFGLLLISGGEVHSVSRVFERMVDLEPSEILEMASGDLIHQTLGITIATERGRCEAQLRRADGSQTPVLVAWSPLSLGGATWTQVAVVEGTPTQQDVLYGVPWTHLAEYVGPVYAIHGYHKELVHHLAASSDANLDAVHKCLDRLQATCTELSNRLSPTRSEPEGST